MAKVKIHNQEEIAKMSAKDLKELLEQTLAEREHVRFALKTSQRKDSGYYQALKMQVARIQTHLTQLTNQPVNDAK